MNKIQILNHAEIKQKTKRMAYQIVEDNYDEKELIMIGIVPNGYKYAEKLKKEIESIAEIKVTLHQLSLNKANPLAEEIKLDLKGLSLNGKTIILVDDVANTGRTTYYALRPLLEFTPKKVQVAVLVDREHKRFPVSSDFVGLSLSTTINEHIEVTIQTNADAAYLV